MTAPAPQKPPTPTCPPAQVGPCANCQQPTHRYGIGGNPLCVICRTRVESARSNTG